MKDIFTRLYEFFENFIWKTGKKVNCKYVIRICAVTSFLLLFVFALQNFIPVGQMLFAIIACILFIFIIMIGLTIVIKILSNNIDEKKNPKNYTNKRG